MYNTSRSLPNRVLRATLGATMSKKKKKNKINYIMGENIHDDVTTEKINWFPGHMNKAVKQIVERLNMVDICLEIRDARSPMATGNRSVLKTIGQKSLLIVINKTNLADPKAVALWQTWFSKQEESFVFINAFDKNSLKKIVDMSKEIVHRKRLLSNPEGVEKTELRMMILGLPNTGKSTIINKLANRNASKAAAKPGQTQHQLWVNVDKDLKILDTPGVMPPKIEKHEHGVWLCALHAIPETVVRCEVPACFIIEHLLKEKSEIFKNRYSLSGFDIDLIEALDQIAALRGCIRHKGVPDYERVYKLVLLDFRGGELGLVSFGLPPED
jgi:ribosome biogenesis GTPase A